MLYEVITLERGARVALDVDPDGLHLFGGDGEAIRP